MAQILDSHRYIHHAIGLKQGLNIWCGQMYIRLKVELNTPNDYIDSWIKNGCFKSLANKITELSSFVHAKDSCLRLWMDEVGSNLSTVTDYGDMWLFEHCPELHKAEPPQSQTSHPYEWRQVVQDNLPHLTQPVPILSNAFWIAEGAGYIPNVYWWLHITLSTWSHFIVTGWYTDVLTK